MILPREGMACSLQIEEIATIGGRELFAVLS
jgi:hypothetical protein